MLTTIIEGTEYDITDFIKTHPGGEMMAQLAVGRDSTYLFWSYHVNQEYARNILKKLPIVSICEETKYSSPEFLFYLQNKIKTLINKKVMRGGMLNRVALWIPLTVILTYLVCFRGWWMISPILGLIMATIGLTIQHDANHGAFSKSSWVNMILGYLLDIIGRSSFMWRLHHNVGHHVHTNNYEKDIDITSAAPLLRLHEREPYKWYHRYQHYYWPAVFLFASIGEFTDITTFVNGRDKQVVIKNRTTLDVLMFVVFKIFHFGLYLIIPTYLFGQWYSFVIMHIVGAYYLSIQFILSHATEDIYNNSNILDSNDWAISQISESSNYSASSKLVNFFTGGLNQQIEHHLFPSISDHHYPFIANVVQKECVKRRINYVTYDSLLDNLKAYVKALKIYSVK
jgi:fatty acid desaturase